MVQTNVLKRSQTRVFMIEDRAGPSHAPEYQTLARATGLTWGQGDINPIRVPDPKAYGRFLTIDKYQGQEDLPSSSIEYRKTRSASEMLKLVRKKCPVDVQIHIGACKDPSDPDTGWELIGIFEDANFTTYNTDDLGTMDADGEGQVMETLDFSAIDYYEVRPLAFGQIAEAEIVQEVVAVVICDARACGACGIPSDGCQRVFAVQKSAGASPGLPAEVVFSQDGGSTVLESIVTSMSAGAGEEPTAMACVGPYLVIISNAGDSLHYVSINDLFNVVEVWAEVTTGFVGAGSPNAIYSTSRIKTWIVGDGGYIYFTSDITTGVTVQSPGDVTSQNLTAIHGIDDDNIIAGGAANALVSTKNGGVTWTLVTMPVGQAAVAINAVAMLNALTWIVGYDDGKLYYTIDGGVNWTQKLIPGGLTKIREIRFATRSVGYISGDAGAGAGVARLLRTISGGYSWYVLPESAGLAVPTAAAYNSVAACPDDPSVVYAGGLEVAAGDGILIKGA